MSPSRTEFTRATALVAWLVSLQALAACSFNITRHTDGPLTAYLQEPLPQLDAPIARTFSLERVTYNTAAGDKGTMISDLTAREIYILPKSVGREVDAMLALDESFDPARTRAALNEIAKKRSEARGIEGDQGSGTISMGNVAPDSAKYIARQEAYAKEAYDEGDYVMGNIHSSAAQASHQIRSSAERTQATGDLVFSVMGAASAAGEAMIKSEFNTLRSWIESGSGAIGDDAPANTHLSLFFLRYFDARKFKLDSRSRVAVYLVLTDGSGTTRSVLEGSDILTCQNECDMFDPKPTAVLYDETAPSNEVQRLVSTHDGMKRLNAMGFDSQGGTYQYVLLMHGLEKLAAMER